MSKSHKLIRYIFKKDGHEKFIKINDFIKYWSDKEVIDIISILESNGILKLETSGYKTILPNDKFKPFEKIHGVVLTEKGKEYYYNNIRDTKVKRFAIYIGAILSILNLIVFFPLWFSTDNNLDKLEQRIESIEDKLSKDNLLHKEELLDKSKDSQPKQKDTLILNNK